LAHQGGEDGALSEDTDQRDAVREILSMGSALGERFGPTILARLLIRAGVKLMAQTRGKAEAQAELRNLLSKAYMRARAARDIDGEAMGTTALDLPPSRPDRRRVLPARGANTGGKGAKGD
jgi:hypothetical protein